MEIKDFVLYGVNILEFFILNLVYYYLLYYALTWNINN